jgi:hypothetical protein
MPKPRLNTIAVLAVALVAAAVAVSVARQPTWQGQTARAWLCCFDTNRSAANEAFRHFGTRAVPLLEQELCAHDAAWKLRVIGWAKSNQVPLLRFTPAEIRRLRAVRACDALGQEARALVPALATAVGYGNGEAIAVLERFGAEAVGDLARALTNAPGCGTPYFAAKTLGRLGAPARPAITNLLWEFEHYPISAPRGASAEAAALVCRAWLEQHPGATMPELVLVKRTLARALTNQDTSLCAAAVGALGKLGPHAGDLLPAVARLQEHSSLHVRWMATNALQALRPAETGPTVQH